MADRELIQAAACLPPQLRNQLQAWFECDTPTCEEIRLRAGNPIAISTGQGERPLNGKPLSPQTIQDTVDRACEYSVHTFSSNISQGFITLPGGHRIGICGEAVWDGERIISFRSISSINIRVARQIKQAAGEEILQQIYRGGKLASSLFFSPPRFGKTTLLRDLTRQLSQKGLRIGIADERSEIAALYRGQPQFDLGPHCDVITGCPKAEAALMLVKTMSPDAVVLDEITSEEDVRAALYCCHCGVAVFASAHADCIDDFFVRPLYRTVIDSRVFSAYFQILLDRTVKQVSMKSKEGI